MWLSRKLSAPVRLKTSTMGSRVAPFGSAKRREMRRSQVKNSLSRRRVFRVRMEPSAQIRSAGWFARSPGRAHASEAGEADR